MTARGLAALCAAVFGVVLLGIPLLFWIVSWIMWGFRNLLPWPAL